MWAFFVSDPGLRQGYVSGKSAAIPSSHFPLPESRRLRFNASIGRKAAALARFAAVYSNLPLAL